MDKWWMKMLLFMKPHQKNINVQKVSFVCVPFPFRPLSSNIYAVGFKWTCPSLTDLVFLLRKLGKRRNSILLCCVKSRFWVKCVSVSSTFSCKTSGKPLELKLRFKPLWLLTSIFHRVLTSLLRWLDMYVLIPFSFNPQWRNNSVVAFTNIKVCIPQQRISQMHIIKGL